MVLFFPIGKPLVKLLYLLYEQAPYSIKKCQSPQFKRG